MKTLLEVRELTKRFGGLVAVDNLNFAIGAGEILGLIGPNGAGKTTVVNLIGGSYAPSDGEISFEDNAITQLAAFRRARLGIARTFQIMKPFRGLTALHNVAVGALFGRSDVADLPQARAEARRWLDFVGLARRADQRADALGGPDRKRLELAKALAAKPKLLLLDEVMAGLNQVEIEEVIAIIKRVRERGTTIIVIEHVMKVIQKLSDRVLVLHHGQQIAAGPPDEVLAAPQVIEAYLGRKRA